MAILLIAAPAKTLAIDTSFNEPGFRLNSDTYQQPNGDTTINVNLDTMLGTLDYLMVGYNPLWIQDKSGEWSQSPDRGWVNMHFFGYLVPPDEEAKYVSHRLNVNKLDGFSVEELVSWSVYDDAGLWSQAHGSFIGSFELNGDVRTSYNEHLFDNGPVGFSVDVAAPIIWTKGLVPDNLASVSVPEPASLALLSLGLISAMRKIRPK